MPHAYSSASGQSIYGGRRKYPAWRPATGTFADIGLNTVADVTPAGWPTGNISGPFGTWGGGALIPDFGTMGGIAWHDSGHAAVASNPQWCGVIMFDIATRLVTMRNVPPAVMDDDTAHYNVYGESTVSATLGHTKAPHTYGGLINRPAAHGGGSQGSLMRVGFASGVSYYGTPAHQFDLSSTTAPAVRKVDAIGGNGYPVAVFDSIRNGFWFMNNNGTASGPLKFYAYNNDGSIAAPVSYTLGSDFNTYGDGNMVHIPERDCLVAIMRLSSDITQVGIFVSPIISGVPQNFVQVAPTGSAVGDARCGGSWCALLNSILCYRGNGSTTVHKLTPPSGSLTGSGWAWTSETLAGTGGATPSSNGMDNGSWGRFIYVPSVGCCIWNDSVSTKPQAFTLTGM